MTKESCLNCGKPYEILWYVEHWMNLNRDDSNLTINQILGEIVSEAMRRGKVEALKATKELFLTQMELVNDLIEETEKSTN